MWKSFVSLLLFLDHQFRRHDNRHPSDAANRVFDAWEFSREDPIVFQVRDHFRDGWTVGLQIRHHLGSPKEDQEKYAKFIIIQNNQAAIARPAKPNYGPRDNFVSTGPCPSQKNESPANCIQEISEPLWALLVHRILLPPRTGLEP